MHGLTGESSTPVSGDQSKEVEKPEKKGQNGNLKSGMLRKLVICFWNKERKWRQDPR